MPTNAAPKPNAETPGSIRAAKPGKPEVNHVLAMRGQAAKIAPNVNTGREPGKPVKLTRQEIERQRVQAAAAEVQRKIKAAEAEAVRARAELKRSQDELAQAKREHENDLRHAAERESGLFTRLGEVQIQATKLSDEASVYRKLFAVTLLLAIPAMVWAAANYGRSETKPAASAAPVAPRPKAKSPDITIDTQRLEDALDHFSNERPQDVLRRVHAANVSRGVSVCSFEWTRGRASMLFGAAPGMAIGSAIGDCADAVEQAAK